MADVNDPVIAFSVRDLLTKMDGKLDTINSQLGTKADLIRVDQLAHSIGDLQSRMSTLEGDHKRDLQTASNKLANRQWFIPTALTGFMVLVGLLQVLNIHI